jgi:hypothetical protein
MEIRVTPEALAELNKLDIPAGQAIRIDAELSGG